MLSLAFAFSMPGLAPVVGAPETWLGDVRRVKFRGADPMDSDEAARRGCWRVGAYLDQVESI